MMDETHHIQWYLLSLLQTMEPSIHWLKSLICRPFCGSNIPISLSFQIDEWSLNAGKRFCLRFKTVEYKRLYSKQNSDSYKLRYKAICVTACSLQAHIYHFLYSEGSKTVSFRRSWDISTIKGLFINPLFLFPFVSRLFVW